MKILGFITTLFCFIIGLFVIIKLFLKKDSNENFKYFLF